VPADWGPEVVIEFDRWIRLRAEAERRLAERPASAREPLVVWDDDGAHAIVLTDRGRAPNLAAVREISIGVWNGGHAPADGEVWINDIRLAAADRRPGLAGTVGVAFRGGGAVDAELSVTRRGGHFRELTAAPSYLAEDAVSLRATVRLDRLVGGAAGWDAPLSVALERSGAAPVFVDGTDVEAGALPGLRPLGGSRVRLGLELRRSDASRRPWMRSTLDALALQLGVARSRDNSPFAASARAEASAGLTYRVQPTARTAAILPATRMFARGAAESGGAGAGALRVRWTPVHVELGTVWSDAVGEFRHFEGLLPSAAPARPELSATRGLAHHASFGVQPLESLSGSVRVRSTSDLLPAASRFDAAAPPGAERFRPAGLDLGRETSRDVATQMAWAPRLSSWLTMRSTLNSAFLLDAGPGLLGATVVGGAPDRAVRSFGNRRALAVRWRLDPVSLARAAGLADSTDRRPRAAALRAVRGMEVGWGSALDSRFDRVDALPDLRYQLGLGGRSGVGGLAPGGPSLLADRTTWTARTQVRLPGGIDASLGFSDAVGLVSGQRGERSDRTREWPALLAHWTGAPAPGALGGAVRGASVSAGYALQSRRWDDRGSAQVRTERSSRVPLDASVQWAHGFSTAYRGEWRLASADAPTASTERIAAEHSVSVSGSMVAPAFLEPALPAPIAVSLRYDLGGQRECRLSPESTACLAGAEFAGHRAQGWSVQADTQASGMRVGLLLDHRDRSNRGSQILEHRRFSLGFFGEFNLQAGRLP